MDSWNVLWSVLLMFASFSDLWSLKNVVFCDSETTNRNFKSFPTTVKTLENDSVLLPCYLENAGLYLLHITSICVSVLTHVSYYVNLTMKVYLFVFFIKKGSVRVRLG